MNSRSTRNRPESGRKIKYLLAFLGVSAASCLAVLLFMSDFRQSLDRFKDRKEAVTSNEQPVTPPKPPREAVDFQMIDFMRGWVAYTDGIMKTEDGGVIWSSAENAGQSMPAAATQAAEEWMKGNVPNIGRIAVGTNEVEVKKTQFYSEKIGWALLPGDAQGAARLWVTVDGGKSWSQQVTPEMLKQMELERLRLENTAKEAKYYADRETAQKAIRSEWTLMPETASPGDIVLVRHRLPGTVAWQGKTYELKPFGSGYFTYLPVPMSAKPGSYPIGDKALTVKAKKFETQYLQVTKQMESMRQDTKRIQEDQKKIDLARSKSEPEFLFTSPFIQPVEGILTTPYGHTRYVNGKYDSSHMAIDLAAKEGTPVKATNDGIVALADSLYLTGNAIYLDHGMNLFSQYAHLSELRVKTGDRVKKGDIIGLVGTTGFSTGPHLHFTFWAHNIQANPNLFFNTEPFKWYQPAPAP